MPRLFAGLEIPDPVSDHLSGLRSGLRKARWIEPPDYHVTLRFFGDIDKELAGEITDQFASIRHPPLTLAIDGLDVFGGNKPRTLFARVAPNAGLNALQYTIEQKARRAGCDPETRQFRPHITIARIKGVSKEKVAAWLQNFGDFSSEPFAVDRFALFSARPSRGGGPYLVEQIFPLE
jgi:RNA 2',3'-cyclic 3'-phosphodiesterase